MRGFVLPTTLLVLTLLTVMLTAAFILVSAEFRTTDNSLAMTRAHSLAQAGLQTYFSMNRAMLGTSDSIRITMSGGYADVVATRLRDSTANRRALWLVRASGFSTDPTQPGQVQALRSVTQLAERNPARFPANAALFAPNGVHVSAVGGSNPMWGDDVSCTPQLDKPGVITPTGLYTAAAAGAPTGNPGILYLPSAAAVIDSTYVDWPSLIGGNFTPDYVLPGSLVSWNTNAVILVNGDYTTPAGLPNPSRGILVVTGNLTLTNDVHWHGVVIAGGFVRGTGEFRSTSPPSWRSK